MVGALPVVAQQTTGTPGAPSATTTIDGRQIPPPPAPFGGTINLDALKSTPYWQPQVVPPKGAPNILLIMTDDVGFGAPSTFGGVIPTPTLDRIAKHGAALHEVSHHGALLADAGRADHRPQPPLGRLRRGQRGSPPAIPGYNSVITKDKATIGTILKANGYATSWFGKNHNTPSLPDQPGGPFRPMADRHGL